MLAGLREGERLWVREVFTLIDATLVPRRDWLVSEGKDPVDGPVARFVSTVPKEVCRPQPDGKNYPGTLAGTRCPLLPPCQGLLPLVSWGICVAPCPRSSPAPPRSLSCWRKLSQGLAEKHQPHGGACSGKNKPLPSKHTQLLRGAPSPLTTGRKGQ